MTWCFIYNIPLSIFFLIDFMLSLLLMNSVRHWVNTWNKVTVANEIEITQKIYFLLKPSKNRKVKPKVMKSVHVIFVIDISSWLGESWLFLSEQEQEQIGNSIGCCFKENSCMCNIFSACHFHQMISLDHLEVS